ncbi:MAG: hypothetical protein LC789_06190 [Actinobacteria bacterium]|nr:hypothetical protein [Actinomycetota bacterium]MCA1720269.1 hypothetical protein [Actinomycetota bacterium]
MQLTDLEIASGTVVGGSVAQLPETRLDARAALEQVLLTAMSERRAVVSFSGGRDSSTVLALATHVARREGLPDPVPLTKRYPGVPEADEQEWQELVIGHLQLRDWEIVEFTDELDLVGDVATTGLRRHGLLWPPNAYLHVPLFERCRGSVLMTGYDGDRLFDGWRYRGVVPHLGRRRPTAKDARALASRFAPTGLVVRRTARRDESNVWLTDEALQQATHDAVSDRREPLDWRRRLGWLAGRRQVTAVTGSLAALAGDCEVQVLHPLMDPLTLAGLARTAGRRGWPHRTTALRELFDDLLPDSILSRRTKAVFGGAIVGEATRSFAEAWSGLGVPMADPAALRAEWLSPSPVFTSMTALHAAWLADRGSAREASGRALGRM